MTDESTGNPYSPARPAPRNVPTLTEVVGEQAAEQPAATSAAAGVAADVLGAQALLHHLGPDLDRQISETIGRVLHEQMLGLNARVQKAVAEVVREAVASAIARGLPVTDDRTNP